MNVGLDIDDTITRCPPLFSLLSHALIAAGHKVTIITLRSDRTSAEADLDAYGIAYSELILPEDHELRGRGFFRWKAEVCRRLRVDVLFEDMPEVESYVKNHNLGFFIPYTHEGAARSYIPDFIVRLRADGAASDGVPTRDALNLIIEVSGEPKPEKAAKVETARSLWVPAVNNDGRFGRWSFLEISDPWDAKNTIRAHLAAEGDGRGADQVTSA